MSWGDDEWGGFDWGDGIVLAFSRAFGDNVAQGVDLSSSCLCDVIADALSKSTAFADCVAQGDLTSTAYCDVFTSRLGTSALSGKITQPVLLIEIAFPSGTLRISKQSLTAVGYGWDGRLLNSPEIVRSLGDTVDDMSLVVADVEPRISAGFTDANPPEGSPVTVWIMARDDPGEELIELFTGRVEQVKAVGPDRFSLEVVRADVVLDRVLGRLLDTTIEPNAPDESLGRMIPHVYGTVEEHEGLVTDFNGVSALAGAITDTTTSLILRDGSRFSSSGSADVGEEIVSWTGKAGGGNELTGLTRGVSGTQANAHPAGSKVVERGTFEVKFADHAVTSVEDVRFEDPDGNLAVPEPAPTINAATAKATWSETPRVTFPSRSVEVILVGPDTATGGTLPAAAAPEHNTYTDLNYASVSVGQSLDLSRIAAVEDYGEITRVGLVVAFDPAFVGSFVLQGGQSVGVLSPAENIPAWALRRLQRQMKSTYSLKDPTHNHTGGLRTVLVRPSINISPDREFSAAPWYRLHQSYDGSGQTRAVYWISLNPSPDRHFWLTGANFSLAPGEVIADARLIVWAGGDTLDLNPTPMGPSGAVRVSVHNGATPIVQLRCPNSLNSRDFINVPTQFVSVWINPATLPSNFSGLRWTGEVRPVWAMQAGDSFCIRDMYLHLTILSPITASATSLTQRRSQLNFFDVTGRIGGDWSRFQSETIRLTSTGPSRINGVWWAVEVRPRNKTAIEVPRVFAKVRGLQVDGNPTEIAKKVITQAAPLGMGLTIASVAQGDYATAAASLATDGVRLDFALRQRVRGLDLLRQIAAQADMRQVWQAGRHSLIRKPNVASLPAVLRTYLTEDVLQFSRSRQSIAKVVNQFEVNYRFISRLGSWSRNLKAVDAPSQTLFGVRSGDLDLSLVADTATATLVSARRLARASLPRWLVTLELPLFALDLRRGDVIGLTHNQFTFAKAEVLSLPIVVQGFLKVRVSLIVWSV